MVAVSHFFFFVQQVAREQNLEKSLSSETLEKDCSQILEERRELMNTIYSLRKELRRAEVLQDKVRDALQIPAEVSVSKMDRRSTCSVLTMEQRSALGSVLQFFEKRHTNILAFCVSGINCYLLMPVLIYSPCLSLEGNGSFYHD